MPKNMSGGQKRRLDIAMGLIHDPTLVFLDEPTTGLDPQARANLWEHIADLRRRRGATVFLTTHYLDEADTLSDRIIIIDQGRIVASDTSDNLKAQVAGDLVDLEVADARSVGEAAEKLDTIAERPGTDCPASRSTAARERTRAARGTGDPRPAARPRPVGVTLDSIEVHRPTLDDVFLTLTGRSLRDAEAATERAASEAPTYPTPPRRRRAARRPSRPSTRPPHSPGLEQTSDVPPRQLHRLPPAAADEPAQPGLGDHRCLPAGALPAAVRAAARAR